MVVFHSNNEVFVAILVGMVGWSGTYIVNFFWKKGVEKLQAFNHVYSIRKAVIKKGST